MERSGGARRKRKCAAIERCASAVIALALALAAPCLLSGCKDRDAQPGPTVKRVAPAVKATGSEPKAAKAPGETTSPAEAPAEAEEAEAAQDPVDAEESAAVQDAAGAEEAAAAQDAAVTEEVAIVSPASPLPPSAPAGRMRPKRDPFKSFVEVRAPVAVQRSSKALTPLQMYKLEQLKVVGILMGETIKKALLEDDVGKGYMVQEGDLVGDQDGKITSIEKDRIVVEESYRDPLGEPKARRTVKRLYSSEEGENP
ncbi:MAG: pilus assembly protein PilP [bacterium]